jgi:hypothetical protein
VGDAHVFEHWDDFYLLIGTAAAALLALLFVAVSLGTGYLTEERAGATRTFFSPIVLHYGAVLFLSAVALIPGHRMMFYVVLIAATGLVGLAVSAYTTAQLVRTNWTNFMVDRLAYGLLPAIAYIALIAAAGMMYTGHTIALDAYAGALLLLMLVNIRNAWDLMLSMVRRHGAG